MKIGFMFWLVVLLTYIDKLSFFIFSSWDDETIALIVLNWKKPPISHVTAPYQFESIIFCNMEAHAADVYTVLYCPNLLAKLAPAVV